MEIYQVSGWYYKTEMYNRRKNGVFDTNAQCIFNAFPNRLTLIVNEIPYQ